MFNYSRNTLEPEPDKLESGNTKLDNDIGLHVKCNTKVPIDLKYRLLTDPYKPHPLFDLKGDFSGIGKNSFRNSFVTQYTPRLSYSPSLKVFFAFFCVLLLQPVQRGIQDAFITNPFTKCKQFKECAKNLVSAAGIAGLNTMRNTSHQPLEIK